jgi:outer membrane lipoprotein-sorting protein
MRRRFQSAALVCIAFLSTVALASAQTAEEIIAKNLEAKGGVQLLRGTNTVRVTGTITSPAGKGTVVTLSKRPTMFRREMDISGQKMVQGYDGTTLWMSLPSMAAQEMPPGPQAEALKRNGGDFDSAFLGWKEKGHTVEFKGKVNEGGKEFHHLVLTQKDGPPLEYYIDSVTGLEAKTLMQDPTSKARIETRLTDYRTVDGRTVPFVMTTVVNGSQVAQIRLDRIEFNVPLDDALFRMPK